MFDYLQQFNNLPKNLRDQVSSPSIMLSLSELENKYKLDLAMVVMKVMVKNIAVNNLSSYFISENGLAREAAEELTRELKEKIFIGAADYLGIISDIRALDLEKDIKVIISEAGLTLASSELINRFKSILATYLKGVRAKIDTRAVLGKEVISGGLNLSPVEIDRVFKVCENQKFKSLNISISPSPINSTLENRPVIAQPNRLDKIINGSEGKLAAITKLADYNLKDVIARGEIKKPVQLDLPAPDMQLDLPKEEHILRLEKDLKIEDPLKKVEPVKSVPLVKKEEALKYEVPHISFVATLPKTVPVVQAAAPILTKTPLAAPVLKPTPNPTPAIKPVPTPALIKTQAKVVSPSPLITPAPVKIPATPIAAARPNITRQNLEANPSKPLMHDIKPAPRVMGPIEELQFLDVINFRRLGENPVEAVTKIFNKIKQLEKEGYDKMVNGVRAWRQSPVNRLYITIGQEAISKGITVKEAALARQKDNPEYLKIEEIEAIVNLNSKLVF